MKDVAERIVNAAYAEVFRCFVQSDSNSIPELLLLENFVLDD